MNELTTQPNPFALTTMEDAEKMAKWIAESGCFGITKPAQALTLMLMAKEQGKTLSQLLKEVHVFETGKLSQRADYTQAVFMQTGTILWHLRTAECVAGSFFNFKPIDDAARERACQRFELQYELEILQMQADRDRKREGALMLQLSKLSREGEATIIRTLAGAEASGITQGKNGTKTNWQLGGVAMLQYRCVTDGVKLIDPAVMAGLSSDVDLQDVRDFEQRVAIERQSPQDREKDAIKAMMAQHLEDAETAHPERKRELLGLAAELRCKLAEMDGGIVVATARDERSNLIAAKIVDATDATVHPPEQRPIEEHPDYDNLPGIETPPPKLTKWENHIITTFKVAAYKNKALGSLSKEEIEVLHKSMSKKDLPKESKEVIKEAGMIAMAFEAMRPPKK